MHHSFTVNIKPKYLETMMIRFFADVLPFDPDEHKRIIEHTHKVIKDTVDTVVTVAEPVTSGGGSGSHSLPFIIAGILAALVGLAFLIFMVRSYRRRGEQQVATSVV